MTCVRMTELCFFLIDSVVSNATSLLQMLKFEAGQGCHFKIYKKKDIIGAG